MVDLLAEVDNAMRQERLEKLWQDYGNAIISGVLLAIILTAGFSFYRSWDAGVRTQQTSALMALYEDPGFPGNAMEKTAHLRGGHKALALFTAAGRLYSQQKTAEAQSLYASMAGDSKLPNHLRQLAVLMDVRVRLEIQKADQNLPATDFLKALQPILDDKTSPWISHAHMLAASILAGQSQDYKAAISHLNAVLETENLPESMYGRAEALSHVYLIRQQQQPTNAQP
jgi:hypothetical protein